MREILGKIGKLCENHVEKIVLVIAGIVSAWLFFSGVVFSSDVVKVTTTENGRPVTRNVTPGHIDEMVAQKLEQLRSAMDRVVNRPPDETPYVSRLTGPIEPNDPVMMALGNRPQPKSLQELIQSPLAFLGSSSAAVRPTTSVAQSATGPKYRLPTIPRLTDVGVQYQRAAAYVPTTEVAIDHPYAAAQSQVDDVDLVTVDAKLNVAEIYKQYHAYFNGSEVERESWRDPCMAQPKFAALELQRQEIQDTGLWSEWTTVPPARVCPYQPLFQIIENAKDLPIGGISIRMSRFDSILMTRALLQPDSYQIASPDEQWYPASFYDRYKKVQRQIDAEEKKKKEQDAAKTQTNTTGGTGTTVRRGEGGGARGGATTTTQGGRGSATGGRGNRGNEGLTGNDTGGRGGRGAATGGRGGTNADGQQGGRGGSTRTGARGTRGNEQQPQQGYDPQNPNNQGPNLDQVAYDFQMKRIIATTKLATLPEPLLVWAIDDTAQPGKTYRYRMRVGVFNPVAGTGQVADRDAARKDQAILWSEFTPVTSTVAVHKKLYVFAKDVQDKTKTASVEVARYFHGYWRTEDFQVRLGETIGKEVETKKDRKEKTTDRTGNTPRIGDLTAMATGGVGLGAATAQDNDEVNPPTIDFSTHALVVDLVEVSDWTNGSGSSSASGTRQRTYYDMLYTEDGGRIQHMPAVPRYWSKALSDAHDDIVAAARKDKKALRQFGATARGAGGQGGSYGGGVGRPPY